MPSYLIVTSAPGRTRASWRSSTNGTGSVRVPCAVSKSASHPYRPSRSPRNTPVNSVPFSTLDHFMTLPRFPPNQIRMVHSSSRAICGRVGAQGSGVLHSARGHTPSGVSLSVMGRPSHSRAPRASLAGTTDTGRHWPRPSWRSLETLTRRHGHQRGGQRIGHLFEGLAGPTRRRSMPAWPELGGVEAALELVCGRRYHTHSGRQGHVGGTSRASTRFRRSNASRSESLNRMRRPIRRNGTRRWY